MTPSHWQIGLTKWMGRRRARHYREKRTAPAQTIPGFSLLNNDCSATPHSGEFSMGGAARRSHRLRQLWIPAACTPLYEEEDKELRTKNPEQHREGIDGRVGNRRRIALHERVGKRERRRIGHAPGD